jgi:hypothetical protein
MKSLAILLAAAFLGLVQSPIGSSSLRAEPTTYAYFGRTSVQLDPVFSSVISSFGINIELVRPAFFVPERDVFRFPICGGAVDLAQLNGELTHAGGLRFVQNDRVLSITDFHLRIPQADEFSPRTRPLTALFTADHSLIGRDDLFVLDFTDAESLVTFPTLTVQRVFMTHVVARFTEFGAQQFNQIFGTIFSSSTIVGEFTIKVYTSDEL